MEALDHHGSIIQSNLKYHPDLYKKTLELIEQTFGYNGKNSYDVDFHLLMNPSNREHNHILIENSSKKVVGHIGVSLRSLNTGNLVALLGGIAIHPHYQKKGLLGTLMRNVINLYEKHVALFMLWSNLDQMYAKFDFYQISGQIQTGTGNIRQYPPPNFEQTTFARLSEEDFYQVKFLYENFLVSSHTTFIRDEHIWNLIRKITSTNLFLRRSRQDRRITSYFCEGKGQDLNEIIHEMVCSPEEEMDLIDELSPFKLWLPKKRFSGLAPEAYSHYLALWRVGNGELFKQFVYDWTDGHIAIKRISRNEIGFFFENTSYDMTVENFLVSLFGYPQLKEFENFGHPFYFSGLDSV